MKPFHEMTPEERRDFWTYEGIRKRVAEMKEYYKEHPAEDFINDVDIGVSVQEFNKHCQIEENETTEP